MDAGWIVVLVTLGALLGAGVVGWWAWRRERRLGAVWAAVEAEAARRHRLELDAVERARDGALQDRDTLTVRLTTAHADLDRVREELADVRDDLGVAVGERDEAQDYVEKARGERAQIVRSLEVAGIAPSLAGGHPEAAVEALAAERDKARGEADRLRRGLIEARATISRVAAALPEIVEPEDLPERIGQALHQANGHREEAGRARREATELRALLTLTPIDAADPARPGAQPVPGGAPRWWRTWALVDGALVPLGLTPAALEAALKLGGRVRDLPAIDTGRGVAA